MYYSVFSSPGLGQCLGTAAGQKPPAETEPIVGEWQRLGIFYSGLI